MTDERAFPRYLNEPLEPKRSGHDYGSDRSQGRERYGRQEEERSSSPRYTDERDFSFGDNDRRERSSGASSYGQQGQRNQRDDNDSGGRFPSSPQSSYENGGQRQSSQRGGSEGNGAQGIYGKGEHGQAFFGQGPYVGQSSYRTSRNEDHDQDRGGYRSSLQSSHPSQGVGGSTFQGYKNHGPYSGKGPKGYKRSDQQICDEANQALERDGRVDASEVEVTCNGGVVKLTGKVENRAAKRDAESCVEDIYGVSDVMNELKVENGFFANLFGTGSHSDRNDPKDASKSSNKSSQNKI